MRYVIALALTIAVISGCAHKETEHAKKIHEHRVSATAWSRNAELLMEYDEPRAGHGAEFLIHLTSLKDFRPIAEGPVELVFSSTSGERLTVTVDAPERPGLFVAKATFTTPGEYALTVHTREGQMTDELTVPEIHVLRETGEHVEARQDERHHVEEEVKTVSFTKEQQWLVDFMVEKPSRRSISSSVSVTGEFVPAPNREVTVSAPLSGIVSSSQPLPYVGKKVKAGETLAVIEPPVEQTGSIGQLLASYAEAKNKVALAQSEYDRAKRLYQAKAAPRRRVEEAELALASSKAALEPFETAMETIKVSGKGRGLIVSAPRGGTIVEVTASGGTSVEAGQPLMKIIDTSVLWLQARVPAAETKSLRGPGGAKFSTASAEAELTLNRPVSVNDMVDPQTRTVSVLFEVPNQHGRFKVGMFADVSIKTGSEEKALSLPEGALFEDEGKYFVFIQTAGESFERREVKRGLKDGSFVQVLEGVREGDRVVTRGGYYVKLASMSPQLPHEHGHEH